MRPAAQCCVVAVIGFDRSIPVRGKGILERHGLTLLQYSSPDRGLNALRSGVQVDAIILDASRSIEQEEEEWILEALAVAAAPAWRDQPLPLVVLTSAGMPVSLRRRCKEQGAHAIGRDRFTYRQIGPFILTSCRMHGLSPT
jgi:hypothetical protein